MPLNACEISGRRPASILRALNLAGQRSNELTPTIEDLQRVCEAGKYLEDNRAAIADDPRSLSLLLQLTWTCRTGAPLFRGDRSRPLSPTRIGGTSSSS